MQSLTSIETRTSWIVATAATIVIAMGFGAAWITPVALKGIAAEADELRSVPALAGALIWLGIGTGGILLSWVAERIGVRWTAIGGALMIALGLALSTLGPGWPLYVGHGLFIGLLGIAGINAPIYVYVCKWFDFRRGSALALVSSGSYMAGALWPPGFERAIAHFGWRQTMLLYAVLQMVVIVPLAALFFSFSAGTAGTRRHIDGGCTQAAGSRLAAECRVCTDRCGQFSVLRADGDTAGASDRVLRRYRHQRGARRRHAVFAARRGVLQPAGVGMDRRPHWRPAHRVDRLCLSDRHHDGIPADA